jgi:hypothetical protein
MARWHADLQEYDYEIQHIPGKTNTSADVLSRPPDADQGKDDNQGIAVIPPDRFIASTTTIQGETITEEQKRQCMGKVHDHPTAGHPGRTKDHLQWPGMNIWIANYIKGCTTCQQNKIITHQRHTLPYNIPTTSMMQPFQQIAMDLITGLPRHQGFDAILTIVNHGCSWAAIFLPCATTITGPGIAQLYMEHIYRWFRLPKKLISD